MLLAGQNEREHIPLNSLVEELSKWGVSRETRGTAGPAGTEQSPSPKSGPGAAPSFQGDRRRHNDKTFHVKLRNKVMFCTLPYPYPQKRSFSS